MDDDDAADLLGELPEDQRSELLAEMEPETAGELRDLVEYDEDTRRRPDDDRLRVDLPAPHRRRDDRQDPRDRAGVRVHLLPVRPRPAREAAGRPLAAHAVALAPDGVHPQADGYRRRERPHPTRANRTSPRRSPATTCSPVPCSTRTARCSGIVTVDDAIDAIIPEKLANSLPRFTRHHLTRNREPAATG